MHVSNIEILRSINWIIYINHGGYYTIIHHSKCLSIWYNWRWAKPHLFTYNTCTYYAARFQVGIVFNNICVASFLRLKVHSPLYHAMHGHGIMKLKSDSNYYVKNQPTFEDFFGNVRKCNFDNLKQGIRPRQSWGLYNNPRT